MATSEASGGEQGKRISPRFSTDRGSVPSIATPASNTDFNATLLKENTSTSINDGKPNVDVPKLVIPDTVQESLPRNRDSLVGTRDSTGISPVMSDCEPYIEEDVACCFWFIKSKKKRIRFIKGYTGQQPLRKHKTAQHKHQTSLTKTGPYQHARRDESKMDDRQFYVFVWSTIMGHILPRDVRKMNSVQLRFFLPILLQFGHLKDTLVELCQDDQHLRSEIFFWMRSNPDPIAVDFVNDENLKQGLADEFFPTADFYETKVLRQAVQGEFKTNEEILVPESRITVPIGHTEKTILERVRFKKVFSSGHAPVLIQLTYRHSGDKRQGSPGRSKKHRRSNSSTNMFGIMTYRQKKIVRLEDQKLVSNHSVAKTPPQSKKILGFSVSKSEKNISISTGTDAKRTRKIRHARSRSGIHRRSKSRADDTPPRLKMILLKPDAVGRAAGVTRMMELFNFLWKHSWMHGHDIPQALSYMVIPGGPDWGFLECIPDAKSVKEFDFASIQSFFDRSADSASACRKLNTFLRSTVGGLIAGHVLGLRDRHSDNIMISEGYKFYHIDFKHCFNLQTKVVDAPSMVIPKGLHTILLTLKKWESFVRNCVEAFAVLRRSSEHLIRVSQLLFAGLVDPDVVEKSYIQCFYLGTTEKKAKGQFKNHVYSLPGSITTKLKEFVHANSPNLRSPRPKRANSKTSSRATSPKSSTYRSPLSDKSIVRQPSIRNSASPRKFTFAKKKSALNQVEV